MIFFRAPKSLTAIKHVFGRDGRVERKRLAFVSDWLTKKVFIKDDRSLQRLFFSRV